jgi:protein kinase A
LTPIRTPSSASELASESITFSSLDHTKPNDKLINQVPPSAIDLPVPMAPFKHHQYLSISPSHPSPLSPYPQQNELYPPVHDTTHSNNFSDSVNAYLQEDNKDYFSQPIINSDSHGLAINSNSSNTSPPTAKSSNLSTATTPELSAPSSAAVTPNASAPKSPNRTVHTVGSNSSKKYGTHAVFTGSAARRRYQVKRNKHRKLRLDDFIFKQTLGTGACGRVHLAQSKFNKKHYAIKTLNKYDVVRKKQVTHTNNEFAILKDMTHPFLVTLWDAFQDDSHLFMVMDFIPGGELFRVLRRQKVKTRTNTNQMQRNGSI